MAINESGYIPFVTGKTLTIEEGVQVVLVDYGVGISQDRIYNCRKVILQWHKTNRRQFSVVPEKRIVANKFDGLWSEIIATKDCSEMSFNK